MRGLNEVTRKAPSSLLCRVLCPPLATFLSASGEAEPGSCMESGHALPHNLSPLSSAKPFSQVPFAGAILSKPPSPLPPTSSTHYSYLFCCPGISQTAPSSLAFIYSVHTRLLSTYYMPSWKYHSEQDLIPGSHPHSGESGVILRTLHILSNLINLEDQIPLECP